MHRIIDLGVPLSPGVDGRVDVLGKLRLELAAGLRERPHLGSTLELGLKRRLRCHLFGEESQADQGEGAYQFQGKCL